MKGWVKGGLIGLALYIITAISNIAPLTQALISVQNFFMNLFLGSSLSFSEILRFAYIFSLVIAPLACFGIGALIGWIIGKIKARRQK